MTNRAKLTNNRLAALQALDELPDDKINTTDIPEILDWTGAKRGVFYRPVKQQITLRLDADIISWFKAHAQDDRGYQADINRAPREHVLRCESGVTP
ncbi:MAG: BrnA antitoxin family protein [Caldilineaceae bacterium]|nr:BrnA antitoxin family protein [Caldilineaceae bacterium]